jgi:flavin reductase (DIM6/NTAB) family NADH-FMN oxidoreductase RutF
MVSDLKNIFLDAMSSVACTVNVITTDGAAGRAGMTVSAMSSVSADGDKPVLLVCLHHKAHACDIIRKNNVFCVNVLNDTQKDISDIFAGRVDISPDARFSHADWIKMPSGSPRLSSPLAAFDCQILSAERIGTHYVCMGAVQDVFKADDGVPLIYANRSYGPPVRFVPEETDG